MACISEKLYKRRVSTVFFSTWGMSVKKSMHIYLVSWNWMFVDKKEVDLKAKSITAHIGMRHCAFKKGSNPRLGALEILILFFIAIPMGLPKPVQSSLLIPEVKTPNSRFFLVLPCLFWQNLPKTLHFF